MNRRDFITNLFGAAAAALVLPQVEHLLPPVSWPDAVTPYDPGFAPVFEVTLREFRRLFDASYRGYLGQGYVLDETRRESCLGMMTTDGLTLRHQINVGFDERDFRGESGRYLPAAAGALGIAAAQQGVGVFVPPMMPRNLLYAERFGPVRMAVAYDPVGSPGRDPGLLARFDVLGAETLQAGAKAESIRQQGLKVRIRERLLVTHGTQLRLPA